MTRAAEIGIVIGRLSPPVPGRLQAFPRTSWADEFPRARSCGFDALEWVFEDDRPDENPLWTTSGVAAMGRAAHDAGVRVSSVCADYFMAHPLFADDAARRADAVDVLRHLVQQSSAAGIRTVLLPVLEAAELRSASDKAALLASLETPLDLAARLGLRIGLETELPAAEYRDLVLAGSHPALGVYYDVGNATARGFDAPEDVRVLGPWLVGVHLKDRRRAGPSVPLGEGDVDFAAVFEALRQVGYRGPLVLQPAMRASYLEDARVQLTFVRDRLGAAAPMRAR